MVNQVDLKVGSRAILWYSLCEERGSLGTVLLPCRSIYTYHRHNIAQHATGDHYNAIVSHNNSLAKTRMVCCRMVYLFVFFGKQQYASIMSEFPNFCDSLSDSSEDNRTEANDSDNLNGEC